MSRPIGNLADLSWARQAVFGTNLVPTHSAEIISENILMKRIPGFSEGLRGVTKRRHFLDKKIAEGPFVNELMYEGFDLLYENLFGDVADAVVEAGANSHTFTLVNAVLEPGLTLDVDKNEGTNALLYDSCTITKATFRADIGKILRGTWDVFGREQQKVAIPTKFFPPEQPILHTHMAVEIDDVAVDAISFEVTIDEARDNDRRKLGSEFIKAPCRSGGRVITGILEIEFEDYTEYDKYIAGTLSKLELICTGGIIGATSTPYLWHLTLPECLMTGDTPVIGGPGPVVQRLVFEALYDVGGAADAATLVTQNANTTT